MSVLYFYKNQLTQFINKIIYPFISTEKIFKKTILLCTLMIIHY